MQITKKNDGRVLEVVTAGKLADIDNQKFVPEFERLARLHGKMRVLFVAHRR